MSDDLIERLNRYDLIERLNREVAGWIEESERLEKLVGHYMECAEKAEARVKVLEADVAAAADELLVPLPEPGTDMARVLIANRILKARAARAEQEFWHVKRELDCGSCSACEEPRCTVEKPCARHRTEALEQERDDARDLAVEVAMGVTHSPDCHESVRCVRCERDAERARADRLIEAGDRAANWIRSCTGTGTRHPLVAAWEKAKR